MADFKVGDQVVIVPDDRWKQPVRGWAERKRVATVESISRGNATIRFNNARNKASWNVERFNLTDLLPTPPQEPTR